MTKQYLDKSGLTYFYGKVKDKFVEKESGKGLSTNDYTTNEKNKLSGISAGAEVNTIETIKVNGTALVPDANKAVNVITSGGGSTYTAGDGINITNNVISSVISVAPYTTKSGLFGGIQEYYISFDQLKTGVYRAVRDTSKPIYLRLPINRNGSGSYTYSNIALTTDSILIVDNTAYNAYNAVGYLAANSTITVIDGRVIHTHCLSNVFVDSPTGAATANNNTWSESYTTDYVDNTRTLATDYWYNQLDPNSNVHIYTVSATIGTLTVEPGDMIIGNPKKSITGQASSPKLYSYSTNSVYTFAVANSGNITITNTVDWIPSTINAFDSLPVGAIISWTTNTAPDNYLICDGSAVSRTTYADLFSVIGTTYGTGDGSTTFNLPNLKGRVAVGKDSTQTEFDTLGKTGGSKYLQAHSHSITVGWGEQDADLPSTYYPLSQIGPTYAKYMNTGGSGGNFLANTGTGNSENLQPYIVVNYIIKAHPSAVNTSEVVNEHSTSETDTYSCSYVNEVLDNKQDIVDYSTSEVDTGVKWIDGKPIYRKVVEFTSASSGSAVAILNNVAMITRFDYLLDNSYLWSIPVSYYIQSGSFYFKTEESWVQNKNVKAIIEYTKNN